MSATAAPITETGSTRTPPSSRVTAHLEYRPDIDGMRALAILAVVIYHAFPKLLTGGFIGVDIFFVISGYLISGIIFKSVATNTFSFYDFYNRRVRRIFPALLLVLSATFIAGWFILMGDDYKRLSIHTIAGIVFIQNINLYSESGYFDVGTETKPLMHLWSLGVEEQFYLLFPIAIIALWRFKFSIAKALILAGTISFLLGVYFIKKTPTAVFFLPQYRIWELLCGSGIAYISIFRINYFAFLHSALVRNWLSFSGLAITIFSISVIDQNKLFPGWWALLPVTGSVLLISAGPEAWINKQILASKPMVFIGLISYPLYLWHWPIFSFAHIVLPGPQSVALKIGLLIVSSGLAWGTFNFLEKRLRNNLPPTKAFYILTCTSFIYIGFCVVTWQQNGFPARQKDKQVFAQYFANGRPDWHYFKEEKIPERFRMDCDWYNMPAYFDGNATNVPVPAIGENCYKSVAKQKVLFWGDSHSQQYIFGVTQVIPKDVGILSVASSACIPNLPEFDTSTAEYCKKSNEFAIKTIKDQQPNVVIIGQIIGHDVLNNLPKIAEALKGFGVKNVIVMGPVPRWETRLYEIILRKYWVLTPRFIKDDLVKDVFDSEQSLKAKYGSDEGGFHYLSMIDLLCNEDGCRTYIGDDRKTGMTSFDNSHLTPAASVYTAETALVPVIMSDLGR